MDLAGCEVVGFSLVVIPAVVDKTFDVLIRERVVVGTVALFVEVDPTEL